MKCVKCGTENPDGAQLCRACSWVLSSTVIATTSESAKTSGLAITALVLAVLSPFTCLVTAIPAVVCGIVGLVKIEKSGGLLKGRGFAIAGIVVPSLAMYVAVIFLPLVFFLAKTALSKDTGIEVCRVRSDVIWVKCSNPDCGVAYQIDKIDYYASLAKEAKPGALELPGIICRDCAKKTVYRAEKCENCGAVFIRGSVAHDFTDRCPKCNYSKLEQARKDAREKARQKEQGPK